MFRASGSGVCFSKHCIHWALDCSTYLMEVFPSSKQWRMASWRSNTLGLKMYTSSLLLATRRADEIDRHKSCITTVCVLAQLWSDCAVDSLFEAVDSERTFEIGYESMYTRWRYWWKVQSFLSHCWNVSKRAETLTFRVFLVLKVYSTWRMNNIFKLSAVRFHFQGTCFVSDARMFLWDNFIERDDLTISRSNSWNFVQHKTLVDIKCFGTPSNKKYFCDFFGLEGFNSSILVVKIYSITHFWWNNVIKLILTFVPTILSVIKWTVLRRETVTRSVGLSRDWTPNPSIIRLKHYSLAYRSSVNFKKRTLQMFPSINKLFFFYYFIHYSTFDILSEMFCI